MNRNSSHLFWATLVLSLGGNACSSGSSAPPPPPPPAIGVSLAPNGAQMVDQGQSKSFTATVSNDSANKGVNWTLLQNGTACSPGCGTIAPASTASGATANYTAPAAVNANLQFTVTATSVADNTKSASDSATAVPPTSLNNPATLPAATVGQPYSFQLTEAGGVPPFAWSIVSGSLPAGLTLNAATGIISGTPTVASQAVPTATKAQAALQPDITPSTFTVQGCDSGTPPLCSSQLLNLLVGVAADFSLSAAPNSLSVAQGASGTSTITINPSGGFNGAVSLAASGLPAGVTASFSAVANNASTLTLTASSTATIGAVTVTVAGTSGGLSHTATVSLNVTAVASCILDSTGSGPPNSNVNLAGTYVYRFSGFDANGNAVARVGEFTADGNQNRGVDNAFGHITAGQEDVAIGAGGGTFNHSALPPSTYCISFAGSNNSGDITIGTVKYRLLAIGSLGSPADSVSFIEFDDTDKVRGSGVMRLQKATTIAQTGNVTYVFGMSGRDNSQNTNLPMAAVGQFTVDPTLLPVPGPSGLKGEEDVSEAAIRGQLGPGFYRTLNASLNSSTDSNGKLIPARYTGQIAADPPTTPGDIGSGSIDFVAYVVKAAGGAPTTNDSTELFVVSTGTPTATVLSGEIVSQNFATNSTFNNSATPHTPDARAMSLENFYITGGLVNDIPNTVAYSNAATESVALIGFVSFDGSRKPAAAVGNVLQLESDTDIAGNVQAPAQLPAPATYKVTPTGAVTFTGGGILLPEIVLYLSDVDTGFAIVDDPQFLLAGFGRVLPSRNPGPGVVPVLAGLTIGDLPTPVPGSATTVGFANAFSLNGGPGVKIVQDVDDPAAGLVLSSQLGVFPITPTDSFGRFTVGTCPAPAQSVVAPCFVGYFQFFSPDGIGALVLDETTAGFDSATTAPAVRVWGVVP